MCVIFIAEDQAVPPEMVSAGFAANPAGAGAAWREDGWVRWVKGLELPEIQKLAAEIPTPYVLHFRIPSVGGKRADLCHPFPINKGCSTALEGKTKDFVLFHNGHWNAWRSSLMEAVVGSNTKMPEGKWSDTRSMALHAHIYGLGILELIDEKAVAFGPDQCEVFSPGSGWRYHDAGNGNHIWCSNMFWEHKTTHSNVHHMGTHHRGRQQTTCKVGNCYKDKYGDSAYCYEHAHLDTDTTVEELPVVDGKRVADGNCSNTALVTTPVNNEKEGRVSGPFPKLVGSGVTNEMLNDMGVSAGEVRPNETPFELATRLYNSEPKRLSRNKWKKYRKLEEGSRAHRLRMERHQKRFHEMTEPPLIIH